MYYGLRFSGTEDIDSAKQLQEPVKQLIREIAKEKELPVDWLNALLECFFSVEMKRGS